MSEKSQQPSCSLLSKLLDFLFHETVSNPLLIISIDSIMPLVPAGGRMNGLERVTIVVSCSAGRIVIVIAIVV
jgi:hypothetical protein